MHLQGPPMGSTSATGKTNQCICVLNLSVNLSKADLKVPSSKTAPHSRALKWLVPKSWLLDHVCFLLCPLLCHFKNNLPWLTCRKHDLSLITMVTPLLSLLIIPPLSHRQSHHLFECLVTADHWRIVKHEQAWLTKMIWHLLAIIHRYWPLFAMVNHHQLLLMKLWLIPQVDAIDHVHTHHHTFGQFHWSFGWYHGIQSDAHPNGCFSK